MPAEKTKLVAVGLSHHTAPVEVREKLAMDESMVIDTLTRLRQDGVVDEAMLISTCNRVELYAVPREPNRLQDYLPRGRKLSPYLYWHRGESAVRHLFRVASSLDSLVLGEPQILGQVKDAVRVAERAESLGKVLRPLTQRTMSVAKKVRTETDIGKNRVGIGNAGVDLALQVFGGLRGRRALLVGVGDMGRQVARALLGEGLAELLICNRTLERASELAETTGGTAVPWERLNEYLSRVDIVITATGAQKPFIDKATVAAALRRRRWETLFLVDLSVPRNIDPAVDDLEEAYLFNIDDLVAVVGQGQDARVAAAKVASELVESEAVRFMHSLSKMGMRSQIAELTLNAEQIRVAELQRSSKMMMGLSTEQRDAIDAMTRAIVKKLLHPQIREIGASNLVESSSSSDPRKN
ncbi:MAG: glutamyl-tRNA reductase [Rhodobacterales bacterium]|nr:glutamyl-tRNA reductase [Rhodobacterales bacterium]